MIKLIDFVVFGSGRGLGAPFFDQTFFWLVDSHTKKGTFYSWCGWFGSQLQSFQWTHPKSGERRLLCGKEFRPFQSTRSFLRVRVSWKSDSLQTNEDILEFRNILKNHL